MFIPREIYIYKYTVLIFICIYTYIIEREIIYILHASIQITHIVPYHTYPAMPPPCPYPTIPSPLPYIRFNSVALQYIPLHSTTLQSLQWLTLHFTLDLKLFWEVFSPVLFFFLGFPVLSIFLALYRILEVEGVFGAFLSSNLPFSMEFATFWCYCSIWSWMLRFQRYLQHVWVRTSHFDEICNIVVLELFM